MAAQLDGALGRVDRDVFSGALDAHGLYDAVDTLQAAVHDGKPFHALLRVHVDDILASPHALSYMCPSPAEVRDVMQRARRLVAQLARECADEAAAVRCAWTGASHALAARVRDAESAVQHVAEALHVLAAGGVRVHAWKEAVRVHARRAEQLVRGSAGVIDAHTWMDDVVAPRPVKARGEEPLEAHTRPLRRWLAGVLLARWMRAWVVQWRAARVRVRAVRVLRICGSGPRRHGAAVRLVDALVEARAWPALLRMLRAVRGVSGALNVAVCERIEQRVLAVAEAARADRLHAALLCDMAGSPRVWRGSSHLAAGTTVRAPVSECAELCSGGVDALRAAAHVHAECDAARADGAVEQFAEAHAPTTAREWFAALMQPDVRARAGGDVLAPRRLAEVRAGVDRAAEASCTAHLALVDAVLPRWAARVVERDGDAEAEREADEETLREACTLAGEHTWQLCAAAWPEDAHAQRMWAVCKAAARTDERLWLAAMHVVAPVLPFAGCASAHTLVDWLMRASGDVVQRRPTAHWLGDVRHVPRGVVAEVHARARAFATVCDAATHAHETWHRVLDAVVHNLTRDAGAPARVAERARALAAVVVRWWGPPRPAGAAPASLRRAVRSHAAELWRGLTLGARAAHAAQLREGAGCALALWRQALERAHVAGSQLFALVHAVHERTHAQHAAAWQDALPRAAAALAVARRSGHPAALFAALAAGTIVASLASWCATHSECIAPSTALDVDRLDEVVSLGAWDVRVAPQLAWVTRAGPVALDAPVDVQGDVWTRCVLVDAWLHAHTAAAHGTVWYGVELLNGAAGTSVAYPLSAADTRRTTPLLERVWELLHPDASLHHIDADAAAWLTTQPHAAAVHARLAVVSGALRKQWRVHRTSEDARSIAQEVWAARDERVRAHEAHWTTLQSHVWSGADTHEDTREVSNWLWLAEQGTWVRDDMQWRWASHHREWHLLPPAAQGESTHAQWTWDGTAWVRPLDEACAWIAREGDGAGLAPRRIRVERLDATHALLFKGVDVSHVAWRCPSVLRLDDVRTLRSDAVAAAATLRDAAPHVHGAVARLRTQVFGAVVV